MGEVILFENIYPCSFLASAILEFGNFSSLAPPGGLVWSRCLTPGSVRSVVLQDDEHNPRIDDLSLPEPSAADPK